MDEKRLREMLSGGYIVNPVLDLCENRFAMSVEVLENGTITKYSVAFETLSKFEFTTESRFRGDALEITELWIEATPRDSPSEDWHVLMSIWDLTHLRLACNAIFVDGVALQ